MAERYDLKVARQGKDGKVWWTKIGVMFPMRERDGFNITLEALPLQSLNDQGQLECRITAWEPYKEDERSADNTIQAEPRSQPTSTKPTVIDDEIPF
jgi:hypothetical protein